jgi:hypothetical protein
MTKDNKCKFYDGCGQLVQSEYSYGLCRECDSATIGCRTQMAIERDCRTKMAIEINSTCKQCKKDDDLMVAFTDYKVCGKCTRKNHEEE